MIGDRLAYNVLDCLTIALFYNSRVFFSCFWQFSSQPASHDNYDLLAKVGFVDSKPTLCIIHLYLFNKNTLINCTATTIWNMFSTEGCKYVKYSVLPIANPAYSDPDFIVGNDKLWLANIRGKF